MGFLVVKMALGRVILREDLLRLSPLSIILPLLRTPISFIHHRSYITPANTASLNKTLLICVFLTFMNVGFGREPCLRASAWPSSGAGRCLGAKKIFGCSYGSNNTNLTLYETLNIFFTPFCPGKESIIPMCFISPCNRYSIDADGALRIDQEVKMGLHLQVLWC